MVRFYPLDFYNFGSQPLDFYFLDSQPTLGFMLFGFSTLGFLFFWFSTLGFLLFWFSTNFYFFGSQPLDFYFFGSQPLDLYILLHILTPFMIHTPHLPYSIKKITKKRNTLKKMIIHVFWLMKLWSTMREILRNINTQSPPSTFPIDLIFQSKELTKDSVMVEERNTWTTLNWDFLVVFCCVM